MYGRYTTFDKISQDYGYVELMYKDLSKIPELIEVYNNNGENNIIIYKVQY